MSSPQLRARPSASTAILRQVAQRQIFAELGHVGGTALIAESPLLLIGLRGYYEDDGQDDVNDFGIYDDALYLVRPNGTGVGFNGNVDPSRAGRNKSNGLDYAMLTEGVYVFRQGSHYPPGGDEVKNALRQLTPKEAALHQLARFFTDDDDPRKEGKFRVRRVARNKGIPEGPITWGTQNINVHPGGLTGTGSAGCQTIRSDQWKEFSTTLYDWMRDLGQTANGALIGYVLMSARFGY